MQTSDLLNLISAALVKYFFASLWINLPTWKGLVVQIHYIDVLAILRQCLEASCAVAESATFQQVYICEQSSVEPYQRKSYEQVPPI